MKKIYCASIVAILLVLFYSCQKDLSSNTFDSSGGVQTAPITASLQGNIIDENDNPVAGVVINAGTSVASTDSKGYFKILQASLDKNASLVTATFPGYFKAYRTFSATSGTNQVVIKLIKKTLAGTIDASKGGSITLANGSVITLPANSVMSTNGAAYTQSVNVYASYIDPALRDIGKTIPGSFMADDKNNKRVVLSSYGMLAVNLENASGEKLQLAPPQTATLTFSIPASKASAAPSIISLWYLDEQSGIWKEQGSAVKKGSNYEGQVHHFSYWNCDANLPGVSFKAVFKTSDGKPLMNTSVTIQVLNDSGGCAHGYTDSLGQVAGLVPANVNLKMNIYDECYNVVYTKNIGSFSADTDLGTIIIDNSNSYITTIKGQLVSCNNTAVTKGYARIEFDNLVYNANADATGAFELSFFSCNLNTGIFNVTGVDENAQQQGNVNVLPVTSHNMDIGSITACGTSTLQFINYTLDGKDYSIGKNADDSITASNAYDSINGGSSLVIYINGNAAGTGKFLDFAINNNAAGTYQMLSIDAAGFAYGSNTIVKPFPVTITKFASLPGDYYEGNFSGSFKDANGSSHTIKCSFRALRMY